MTSIGVSRPCLEGLSSGGQGQSILNVGNILLKQRQLLALRLRCVPELLRRMSLHSEQAVVIGFVGREDHIEFRIFQIEPGQITLEIVVAQQSIGAQAQEVRERGIGTQTGRFTQIPGSRLQKRAVGDVIRHALEVIPVPAYDGGGTVNFVFLLGMVLHVLLDLLAVRPSG